LNMMYWTARDIIGRAILDGTNVMDVVISTDVVGGLIALEHKGTQIEGIATSKTYNAREVPLDLSSATIFTPERVFRVLMIAAFFISILSAFIDKKLFLCTILLFILFLVFGEPMLKYIL